MMGEPCTESFGTSQKTRKITKLAQPSWNLGGTFCGTFWRPKTDLPQRTIESPKAILPGNLYYGWRPQSYCCWGKIKSRKPSLQSRTVPFAISPKSCARDHRLTTRWNCVASWTSCIKTLQFGLDAVICCDNDLILRKCF